MKNKIMLLGLLVIAVVLVSGCAQENGKPTIKVKSPLNGSTVGRNVVIQLETTNLEGAHILLHAEGTDALLTAVNNTFELKNLIPGVHRYAFTARKNDGVSTDMLASVTFTVKASQVPLTESASGSLLDNIAGEGTKSAPKNVATPPSLPTGKFIGK